MSTSSPGAKTEHDRFQFSAGLGQEILAVEPLHQFRLLELAETLGEQCARQTRQTAAEIIEATCADKQITHYQQGPPFAEHIEGTRDGAVLAVSGVLRHDFPLDRVMTSPWYRS